ncbi:MAG: glutamine synthetase, partial [Eubacteriales bacterium]
TGESLDKKTPLLRSMEALNTQALRILRVFGNTSAKRVNVTVGAEQEYFLVDKSVFLRRADLLNCGRTLFGAPPPKGQEMDDHYFGRLKPRVSDFMKELDEELWKLGILCKTKHNEVAPAQHELAPIFTTTNLATDQNQVTMELLKTVADRHGMSCLLHEKPFAGINGSGKHNNWSMSTDTGLNLLEPGETPYDNAQFLLFLCAVIKAVDLYQDMLRISVASAGNDHRLGGNEAPPAIVSMFIGDELVEVLKALEQDTTYKEAKKGQMHLGAVVLPHFRRDSTDRNRTSPFAFTGNKFEFRMVGSSFSIAGPNIVLNTAVADQLESFADLLEKSTDFEQDLNELVRKTIIEHNKVIFNGNNYAEEWTVEAEKRGLYNLRTTADALATFLDEKNISLFTRHKVFSKEEMHARYEISLETYNKTLRIEALTLADMVKKEILAFSMAFQKDLLSLQASKNEAGISVKLEKALLCNLSDATANMYELTETLEGQLKVTTEFTSEQKIADFYRDTILPTMNRVREQIDLLETIVPDQFWEMPTYAEMLHSVN